MRGNRFVLVAGMLGLLAVWWTVAPACLLGQEVTAELLLQVKTEAAKLLETKVDTGNLVLREDYFKDKFNELVTVEGDAGPTKVTLRDSQRLVLVATEVAKSMLKVAEPSEQTAAQYATNWTNTEQTLLERMAVGQDPIFVGPFARQAWIKFFQDWRSEITRLASDRMRDALRQAAYSLLRIALDVEDEWIQTVRSQTASGGTSRSSTAAVGDWTGPHAFPHLYRRHIRIMNRIERRYAR